MQRQPRSRIGDKIQGPGSRDRSRFSKVARCREAGRTGGAFTGICSSARESLVSRLVSERRCGLMLEVSSGRGARVYRVY